MLEEREPFASNDARLAWNLASREGAVMVFLWSFPGSRLTEPLVGVIWLVCPSLSPTADCLQKRYGEEEYWK